MRLRSLLPSLAILAALPLAAQFQPPQPSPGASLTQRVGLTDVSVTYSRPAVRGRTVWGELVPWDQPWRAGANQATAITFSDPVTVQGQPLAAGTYALVMIPGRAEWTVIFNRDLKLWWETTYDAAKDVLRVKVKPAAAESTESLAYRFLSVDATSAVLALEWEKVRVPIALGVEVDGKIRTLVAAAKAEDWQTPMGAARYFFDQKRNREEAWQWLEKSIRIQRTWANLARKARVLAEEGRTAEAVKAGEEALALAKADPAKPNVSAFEKAVGEWKAKAR